MSENEDMLTIEEGAETPPSLEEQKVLAGAAKKAHEAKQAREGKKGLAPYPFIDGGVNENAAIRVIRMVVPLCPADARPTLTMKNGDEIPNPRYTGEPSCQERFKINNMGRWDVERCIELGHDPYRTTFHKRILEDVLDEEGWVIEQKVRTKVEKRLNIVQVTDNPRHSTRTEVALALARGAKFLEDFNIESPCEFRNCSKKVTMKTRFGRYCGERHARLVGADFKGVMLLVGGDPYSQDQALEEREDALEQINIRAEAI